MRRRFFNGMVGSVNIENYLTMVALEDDFQVLIPDELLYCIDGTSWERLFPNSYTPKIKSGQTISFAGSIISRQGSVKTFKITKPCNLTGNCMSVSGGESPAFTGLFINCSLIKSVSKDFLPATTLADGCYSSMFSGCTSLTSAPELPATELAYSCYYNMFLGCTSLTSAPELPATTLADSCYSSMFLGCTSLTSAPELPATTLADSCYYGMFSRCTSLTSAPELPATELAYSCYSSMFSHCTSLTSAPELPATELAYSCYYNMFLGCTNLNFIKMLATDISADYCLEYWAYNVARTGTFVKSKDATWDVRGVSGIPSNWKIEYDHNYDIGSDISFHIEIIDETLYAKDWMTWDDWVHSKYNTVSARIISSEILIPSYSSYPLAIYPDNIIKNGGTYYFENTGGGSSD